MILSLSNLPLPSYGDISISCGNQNITFKCNMSIFVCKCVDLIGGTLYDIYLINSKEGFGEKPQYFSKIYTGFHSNSKLTIKFFI